MIKLLKSMSVQTKLSNPQFYNEIVSLSLHFRWKLSKQENVGQKCFGIRCAFTRISLIAFSLLRFRKRNCSWDFSFWDSDNFGSTKSSFETWLVSGSVWFKQQDVCLRIILLEINKLHAHLGSCLQIIDRNQM